ncbi:MAG: hypothetical protein GXO85_10375 [Chlorobi bacterium]|nr:hypothetical protein [Chlorobiota bacterium]
MVTKAHIKRKIDRLPNEFLDKVYNYINSLTATKKRRRKIHTFKLKGQFDDVNIREKAYE